MSYQFYQSGLKFFHTQFVRSQRRHLQTPFFKIERYFLLSIVSLITVSSLTLLLFMFPNLHFIKKPKQSVYYCAGIQTSDWGYCMFDYIILSCLGSSIILLSYISTIKSTEDDLNYWKNKYDEYVRHIGEVL